MKVTGIFFTGNQDVTYDVKLSSYDKGVEITAPSSLIGATMPSTGPVAARPDRAARLLLGLAAVAVMFAAADTYVVVLSLPDMMGSVGLSIDELQRAAPIVSGFLLGYVAMLPLIGRIADLRGRTPGPRRRRWWCSRSARWSPRRRTTSAAWSRAASSRASAAAGWCR